MESHSEGGSTACVYSVQFTDEMPRECERSKTEQSGVQESPRGRDNLFNVDGAVA